MALGAPGPTLGEPTAPRTIRVVPPDLEAIVDSLRAANGELRDVRLLLAPGAYDLAPEEYLDPSCGNCQEPATPVPATIGLRISGRRVAIVGAGAAQTVLQTRAGYGLLFDDCHDCRLEGLTVTGGVRDPDSRATDAAIVVREGRLDVEDCEIRDNVGDPEIVRKTVVGIIGICGREGGDIRVTGTRILRNSWDGIALYRDSRATIAGCVIDGIDAARGEEIGGGRGVAIGVTWNSRARIERNLVRNYWKGIGIFVDAQAEARGNVLEDLLTWGIAVWDAGQGTPEAVVERNVIRDVGACGIALTLPPGADGSCTHNLVIGSGRNERYDDPGYYCTQCPVAAQAVPDGYLLEGNLGHDNRKAVPDSLDAHDICREVSASEMQEELRRFAATVERDDVRRDSRTLADVLDEYSDQR